MKYDESDNAFIRASRAVTDRVTDLIGTGTIPALLLPEQPLELLLLLPPPCAASPGHHPELCSSQGSLSQCGVGGRSLGSISGLTSRLESFPGWLFLPLLCQQSSVCPWVLLAPPHPALSAGGLFSKTEMSEVLTEILKVDPSFDKDRFLKQCERDIIPNVLEVTLPPLLPFFFLFIIPWKGIFLTFPLLKSKAGTGFPSPAFLGQGIGSHILRLKAWDNKLLFWGGKQQMRWGQREWGSKWG